MKLFLLTFLILTTWSSSSCQVSEESSNITNFRLPTNLFPINYNLFLTTYLPGYEWIPDERNLTFEGFVTIDLEIKKSTDKIVLHSNSLEIIYAEIRTNDDNSISVTGWDFNQEFQFLNVYLDGEIEPGTVTHLSLGFKGKLRDDNKGFYLTDSRTTTGEKMINAVTQFEATDARSMVPCFDEPEFKATWEVTLHYPAGSSALSNGIATASHFYKDFTITQYEKTPKMSSYLLAVFVGDVLYKQTRTDRDTRIRVYADPADHQHVDHALNVGRITVEGFEKLFGIEYPMEKIDFVSVRNFSAGAMENWGLIVHRWSFILGDLDYVTEVVIHELAHQWFGNLVTMKFWGQIWLNEGFATYMTPFAHLWVNPNYDRDLYYLYEQLEAEKADNKLPLNTVIHAGDSYKIQNINYSKGSSFIRMIEMIVGTDKFLEAIRRYLSQNSYSNVEDLDLYEAIEPFYENTAQGPSIAEFARCWTNQNGYPTIYVEKINGTTIVTQRMDVEVIPLLTHYNDCGYKWDIPIWYQRVGQDDVELTWLTKDMESLDLKIGIPVIVNANSNGYYDVVYSDELYETIADEFKNNSQLYSDSTKIRVLHNARKYAETKQVSIHSLIIIAESLLESSNFDILSRAKTDLLAAKEYMQKRNETDDSDFETIQKRIEELEGKNVFSACDSYETFSSCYEKTFITDGQACHSMILAGKSSTSDRIIQWLKQGSSSKSREKIVAMLSCGDEQTFMDIVNDPSYNWSIFEKDVIAWFKRKFELNPTPNKKEEKQVTKHRKLSDFGTFHRFSLNNFS